MLSKFKVTHNLLYRTPVEYRPDVNLYTPDSDGDIIEIQNCPTTAAAAEIIADRRIWAKYSSAAMLRIRVNERIEWRRVIKLKRHNFTTLDHFVVAIESDLDGSCVVHWRNRDTQAVYTLQLVDGAIEVASNRFIVDFVINALGTQKSVLNDPKTTFMETITDSDGVNLLIAAATLNNHEVAMHLARLPFDVNYAVNTPTPIRAADIAWHNGNQELLLELLRRNSMYPRHFKPHRSSPQIREFLELSECLHAAISDNNVARVKSILDTEPRLRYYFNRSNVSALKMACECGHRPIKRLMEEKSFAPHESDSIADFLPMAADYLLSLIGDTSSSVIEQGKRKLVSEALELADTVPEVKLMLKIIAAHKTVKLHFDFNRDADFSVVRPFNPREPIKLSVKGLYEDSTRLSACSDIVHEMSRYGMYLVFRNSDKPYPIGDVALQKEYERVLQQCEKYTRDRSVGEKINISKAPQILVNYMDNKLMLEYVRIDLRFLFEYYEKHVLPAMELALPVLYSLKDSSDVKFDDLTDPLKLAVLNATVMLDGCETKLSDELQSVQKFILNRLTTDQINKMLEDEVIELKGPGPEPQSMYIERAFINASGRVIDVKEAMEEAGKSKIFLLADHSGTGKSMTFSRDLLIKAKNQKAVTFVMCFSMREFADVYEEFEEKMTGELDVVLEFLLKLVRPKSQIERAIFKNLFKKHAVQLFFDGVDDIAPRHLDLFVKLIKAINSLSENPVWIATRPTCSEQLEEAFGVKAHKFDPFTSKEVEFYIRHNLTGNISEIMKLARYLRADTPLLTRALVELHKTGNFELNNAHYRIVDVLTERAAETAEMMKIPTEVASQLPLARVIPIFAIKFLVGERFDDCLTEDDDDGEKTFVYLKDLDVMQLWEAERAKWTPEGLTRSGFFVIRHWGTARECVEFAHALYAEHYASQFFGKFLLDLVLATEESMTDEEFALRLRLVAFTVINEKFARVWKLIKLNFSFEENYMEFGERMLRFLKTDLAGKFLMRLMETEWRNESTISLAITFATIVMTTSNFPVEDSPRFVEKNLLKLVEFTLTSEGNLLSVFKIVNLLFHGAEERFTDAIMSVITELELSDRLFVTRIYGLFLVNVAVSVEGEHARKFMTVKYEDDRPHPLIFGANSNAELTVQCYEKYIKEEEIRWIFLSKVCGSVSHIEKLNVDNLLKYCKSLLKLEKANEVTDVNLVPRSINEHLDSLTDESNLTKLFLNLIACVEEAKISSSELEMFVEGSLNAMLDSLFRSRTLIDKFFSLIKLIADRLRAARLLSISLARSNFFVLTSDDSLADACRDNAEHFWTQVEATFEYDQLREILLGHNRYRHPLIIGVHFDIETVKALYFKYCTEAEIIDIFCCAADTIKLFFDARKIEKFFCEKFLLQSSINGRLMEFLMRDGRAIFEVDSGWRQSDEMMGRLRAFKSAYMKLSAEAAVDFLDID